VPGQQTEQSLQTPQIVPPPPPPKEEIILDQVGDEIFYPKCGSEVELESQLRSRSPIYLVNTTYCSMISIKRSAVLLRPLSYHIHYEVALSGLKKETEEAS